MKRKEIKAVAFTLALFVASFTVGCAASQVESTTTQIETSVATEEEVNDSTATEATLTNTSAVTSVEGSAIDVSELFSERDLAQEADLTGAVTIALSSNEDTVITEEGVYVLSGSVENTTVLVEAPDDAKIQIVLDGVSITNETVPAIYVKTADKVFVTTTSSENSLKVTGSFVADGDTNLDAVIFSKADLTMNGTGSLEVISQTGNGISSKDDLMITGGNYKITSAGDAIEANDAIAIYDGDITIDAGKDAIHSENTDDTSLGSFYMQNGSVNITAADDAIHANTVNQIDGGTINITSCTEGIEGTYVQINGGEITLTATDDGINASAKSDLDVLIEVNGGTIDVTMASGDTDAFDANGNLTINAGTITIEATSAFDTDGTATLNGGEVTVNGEAITEITQSQMGGGQMGGGQMGGPGGAGGMKKRGF